MKRFILFFALGAAALAGCTKTVTLEPVAKPAWFTKATYFEAKNSMYVEMPIYPTNIVLVGDDYIDRGLWNEFYADTTVKNRGITYDATAHVLYRIDGIAAGKPAKILVSAGYNDIVNDVPQDTTLANLDAIFYRIHKISPETQCYWINIACGSGLNPEHTAAASALNEAMAARAAKGGFELIDIRAALKDGLDDGSFSWNGGLLLNGAGYEALAKALEPAIGKKALNQADDKPYKKEISEYYRHRVSVFQSLPETDSLIVMLGNSLTNDAPWAELFPMGYVINRGISGDMVEGIMQRLDEVAADHPAKIFLQTGANDFVADKNLSAVKLWGRYEKLIQAIHKQMPGTHLYVQSMLPVNPKSEHYEGYNERVAELNKLLEAGGERYDYAYVDIASRLTDEKGDLRDDCTFDGLHLNADGYFLWAVELAKGPRMMIDF